MTIKISAGNSKLGKKVYNISLPPAMTCGDTAPCKDMCYARKAWVQYANVRNAWTENWEAFDMDPVKYFNEIIATCLRKGVDRFRWHVAGDIPKGADGFTYLAGMVKVAIHCPATDFLCFTKNPYVLNRSILACMPSNLKLIFSMWPGLLKDRTTIDYAEGQAPLPLAWYKPKECSDRAYNQAIEVAEFMSTDCNGKCDDCFKCWYMEPGMSVLFEEH